MWFQNAVSGRNLVSATSDDFMLSFYREADRSGWVSLSVLEQSNLRMDTNRPPVLLVDGELAFDLALSKSLDELQGRLDLTEPPTYVGEVDMILAHVWHGKEDEGLGVFGTLIAGRELAVIVYRSDYEVDRTKFPLDDKDLFRRVLQI